MKFIQKSPNQKSKITKSLNPLVAFFFYIVIQMLLSPTNGLL